MLGLEIDEIYSIYSKVNAVRQDKQLFAAVAQNIFLNIFDKR